MATKPIDQFVSTDPFVQAQLIAMGAKGASPDSQIQTQAVSLKTPGVIVPGARGVDQNGVPTQYQAYTTTGREGYEPQSPQPPAFRPASEFLPSRADYASDADYTRAYNAYQGGANPTKPGAPGTGTYGAPAAPGGQTPGQVYSGLVPTGDAELDAAYASQRALIQGTQGPIDEQTIREQTMKRFQAEIDATNQYYNEMKRERQAAEAQRGLARLGTGTAVQAKRGLLGSTFGNSQTDTIENYTQQNQNAIAQAVDSERNAMVQQLLGKARTESQKEIDDKLAARTKGAQEYIDFLKGTASRKEERVSSAVANLLASGSDPDEATYKALAAELGIDVPSLKTKYKQSAASAEAEAAKNAPKPVVIDGVGYLLQSDGTYKPVTPEKPVEKAKPIVVGGVAYQEQADGTYKAVTPTPEVKPITRQVGKVLMTSLDNGLTWQPAKSTPTTKTNQPTLPRPVTPKSTITPKPVPLTQAEKDMNAELSQLRGPDGFLSPQDYAAAKAAWVDQNYSPTTFDTKFRGYRNPQNSNYQVGK